ncbi:MAG: ABC transporter permease [Acidobacteria bacterium]|nr:ABC transporter permease [Acidobacteriota bacterium]
MFQDLRYGARIIVKNPGFTVVAVLSLALGIGANTVAFSLLDAVLFKMLPVKNPEQLVLFRWVSGNRTMAWGINSEDYVERVPGMRTGNSFSYPAFEQFRAHHQSLAEVFAFARLRQVNVTVNGQAEIVSGQLVSGNYFDGLGVHALLGRTLTVDDDKANAAPAAVISYGYWQRRFGGDPSVIGKVIYIGTTAFTIAGITPPEFYGTLDVGIVPDISAPISFSPQVMTGSDQILKASGYWWLNIMGRLKEGVSEQQAEANLNLVLHQHAIELQKSFKDQRDIPQLKLTPGGQGLMGARRTFSQPLKMSMIAVGLVLLIACLNIANLLLARAASRRKEIAVRQAAGANRLRLIRQLLTESILLALLGGALGLLFASWGKDVLLALRPFEGTRLSLAGTALSLDVKLDLHVFVFTTGVSALTGILFGLVPALRATRVDLISALKDSESQTAYSRSRLSKGLIIAQVAISVLLLIGAGLFVRTLRNLANVEVGFNRENLLIFTTIPEMIGYKGVRLANLYQQLSEHIESVPGVRSVTVSSNPLLSGGYAADGFCVPGYAPQPGEKMSIPKLYVGANFFDTMGIPILMGRSLSPQDNEQTLSLLSILEAPADKRPQTIERPRLVAVINLSMARKYFPKEDPIGRRFNLSNNCDGPGGVEIVGVAQDAKYYSLREDVRPTVYLPYLLGRSGGPPGRMSFAIRTNGDPLALVGAVRNAVRSVDPNLPLFAVKTQNEQISEQLSQSRLFASLSSFFGLLALLLASLGIYGVMSYTVARRTHEIGIRMALGARRADVLRMVLRESLSLALIGIMIGVPAALITTRLIEGQLFGLASNDPLTITLITLLMIAITTLAGYLPARKASQIDPMVALRYE